MKKIATPLFLLFATILMMQPVSAQQTYKTSLGLRAGYPSGISAKHFISKSDAIEGVLSFGWGGIGVTALYQIHNPIPDLPGLKWYYGGGAHFATTRSTNSHNPYDSDLGDRVYLGADGDVGLEYVFEGAPISVGVDILPLLNILPTPKVWFNAALSIRYTFK